MTEVIECTDDNTTGNEGDTSKVLKEILDETHSEAQKKLLEALWKFVIMPSDKKK
jgi:hypothetical protein